MPPSMGSTRALNVNADDDRTAPNTPTGPSYEGHGSFPTGSSVTEDGVKLKASGSITELTRSLFNLQSRFKESFYQAPTESPATTALIQAAITLQSQTCKAEIIALRGFQAEETLDLMQKMLDENSCGDELPTLQWKNRVELRRLLVRLSKAAGVLPMSIFLSGVECANRDCIAGGGFADIYRATYKGRTVALKRLRVYHLGRRETDVYHVTFCREALVWKQLCHPRVLPFLGVDCNTFHPSLCLVSPWMPEGNIMDYLKRLSRGYQNAPLKQWIREIIEGLRYLHSECIIHGDLRGANILIDGKLHIKLADFGLSQFVDASSTSLGSRVGGAVRWLAPEVLKGGRPSFASDIYAFGCVYLEIHTRKHPFADVASDTQVVAQILQGHRLKKPFSGGNSNLWDLVEHCWTEDPLDRPPADFVTHSLLVGNECDLTTLDYDIIFHSAVGVPNRDSKAEPSPIASPHLSHGSTFSFLSIPASFSSQSERWSSSVASVAHSERSSYAVPGLPSNFARSSGLSTRPQSEQSLAGTDSSRGSHVVVTPPTLLVRVEEDEE